MPPLLSLAWSDFKDFVEVAYYISAPLAVIFSFLSARRSNRNWEKQKVIETTVNRVDGGVDGLKITINGRLSELLRSTAEVEFAKGVEHARTNDPLITSEAAALVLDKAATNAANVLAVAVNDARTKLITEKE